MRRTQEKQSPGIPGEQTQLLTSSCPQARNTLPEGLWCTRFPRPPPWDSDPVPLIPIPSLKESPPQNVLQGS